MDLLKKVVVVLGWIVGSAAIGTSLSVGFGIAAFVVPPIIFVFDLTGCSHGAASFVVVFFWVIGAIWSGVSLLAGIGIFLSLVSVCSLFVIWALVAYDVYQKA